MLMKHQTVVWHLRQQCGLCKPDIEVSANTCLSDECHIVARLAGHLLWCIRLIVDFLVCATRG